MTRHAIVLVLVSALLHALWNALVKREEDPRAAGLAVLAVATLVAAALGSVPRLDHAAFAGPRALAWGVAAGLCEGAYFVALGLALARGPLGPAYTVARGGAMLVTWPASALLFGEPFTWTARAGASLIAAGLALTSLRPRERTTSSSLRWAALCAVGIGGYHLCYKRALDAGAEPRALFAVALACALPINAAALGRASFRAAFDVLRRSPGPILLAGIMCTASFVVFLQALAVAGAGAVLTLRNTSVLFAQALAVLGGEPPRRRAIVGAVLVAGGALFLTS